MSKDLMRVTAADYTVIGEGDDEEPVVKLAGRDEYGERRVHWVYGTRPYLYVREGTSVPEGYQSRVQRQLPGFETFDGIPVERWNVLVPDDVREIKDTLDDETWEADIPFYRRASIDYDLSGYVRIPDSKKVQIDEVETEVRPDAENTIDPRVVYGDIEVLPDGTDFDQMVEDASCPVTAITLYDSHEQEIGRAHV